MSQTKLIVLESKKKTIFRKKIELSKKPVSVKVPGEKEPIFFKLDQDRIKWSKNGKRFLVGLSKCPVKVVEIEYPSISMKPLSKIKTYNKGIGFNYFLIDRKTGRVLKSKFSKKKINSDELSATRFFGIPVNKKFHDVKANSVQDKIILKNESDPFGHDYAGLINDERVKKSLLALLLLWVFMLGYNQIFKPEQKKVTKIQVENQKDVLRERKKVSQLLSAKGKDKINQRTSKKIKKVISKKTRGKKSSPRVNRKSKQVAKRAVQKRNVRKGRGNKISAVKSINKAKAPQSLQSQLFSRSLKKGSKGRASNNASSTLRGSRAGALAGRGYGSPSGVSGGFDRGNSSGLGSRVARRGGGSGSGNGTGRGGNGVGSLGSRVLLSGNSANISGGLTREQISKVVRKNKRDINRCYESRLQFSPGLSGRVTMGFSINSRGRVTSSGARASTIRDRALKDCIASKIRNWKFDKPVNGRTVEVFYPFNLTYNKGKF